MSKDIELLIDGYTKFRKQYFDGSCAIFENLVRLGQNPKILVIACSDSRVDPAIVMNCQPGDMFVIRNVANLVPPYQPDNSYHGTSAALEFAIRELKVQHVIVFGHSQCGGIRALVENAKTADASYSFVKKWMELAQSACDQTYENHPNDSLEEKCHHCGHYAIINSLKNLATFPWISEGLKEEKLFIHGWFLNLSTGQIDAYDFGSEKGEDLSTFQSQQTHE